MKRLHWMTAVMALVCSVSALEEYELDNELARIRRELARVEEERRKVAESAQRDLREFEEYRSRTQQRFAQIAAETDSVRREVGVHVARRDSLRTIVAAATAEKREYQLRVDRLRSTLVTLCDRLLSDAAAFPPMIDRTASALSFLKSELVAGRIDNSEGMHRIRQALSDVETRLMEIEIGRGVSPVAEIPGTVYRLRVGGIFEAVVDPDGRRCALWDRTGDERWRVIDDPATAAAVLEAVNVREGKAVPSLIVLPYSAGTPDSKEEGQ